MSSVRSRKFAFALLLLLVCGAPAVFGACDRSGSSDAVPGVRLGMSPRDVRERFAGGGGVWQTQVGGGAGASDDTIRRVVR